MGNCVNLELYESQVWNQDDCVVVAQSSNVTVSNMFCSGSHGLSIDVSGSGSANNASNLV